MSEHPMQPQEIAEAGRRIYDSVYRAELEKTHANQFVVIDVTTEKAYVAPHPEEALKKAEADSPNGKFHLIKIGAPGAFKVSYASNVGRHGILRCIGKSGNKAEDCCA
jgi:hypothetical protein